MTSNDLEALRAQVDDLQKRLQIAENTNRTTEVQHATIPPSSRSSIHNLMLLADSALPLGSFAYSSGLESFLAHHKSHGSSIALFDQFLKLSIQTVAYTNVPYMLASFRNPLAIADLDNDLDASTPCTVARRASIAQGRALLSVWERVFVTSARRHDKNTQGVTALDSFAKDLKIASISSLPSSYGHLAPIWGAVSLSLGINLEEAGYVFLLNHAKAVISAGVRASVMGPYQAQLFLASEELQNLISRSLEKVWLLQPEDTGQVVPVMDLWIGRHELLYSRIFNS